MTSWIRLRATLSLTVFIAASILGDFARGTTVFENVGQVSAWGRGLGLTEAASPNAQIGDQISLDGVDRVLTSAQIAVSGQVDNTDVQLTLRLFAQDGPAGSPGTLLYASGPLPRTVNATPMLIDFIIPNIAAPETLTWTLEFEDSDPFLISIIDHAPVSIGSSSDHGWIKPQGQPFVKTFPFLGDGRRFVARFEAIPEPASQFLLVVSALSAASLRRLSRKKCFE